MIKLVFFDIDGTLIRTGGAGVRAFERTAATEFDLPHATRQLKFAGRTDTSLVRELFHHHQVAPVPENFQRFFDRYVFLLDHHLPLAVGARCPGVNPFLRALRALPHPPEFGLLTGNIRLGAEIKLRHFGLWELFETGAFGDDHEDRNRLAGIAQQRGCRLLARDVAGEEILVVGDTPFDVQCGRAIGARTLAVATGGATLAELRACNPDWVVSSLDHVDVATVCPQPCRDH